MDLHTLLTIIENYLHSENNSATRLAPIHVEIPGLHEYPAIEGVTWDSEEKTFVIRIYPQLLNEAIESGEYKVEQ